MHSVVATTSHSSTTSSSHSKNSRHVPAPGRLTGASWWGGGRGSQLGGGGTRKVENVGRAEKEAGV